MKKEKNKVVVDFDLVKNNQSDLLAHSSRLIQHCHVKKVKEPLAVNSADIKLKNCDSLRETIKDYFKGYNKNIIYIITFDKEQETREIQEWFRLKKDTYRDYSMSKINDTDHCKSKVL